MHSTCRIYNRRILGHDEQELRICPQEFFEADENWGEAGLRDRLRNVLHNEFVRITYTQVCSLCSFADAYKLPTCRPLNCSKLLSVKV
jgi:hypothetical protein